MILIDAHVHIYDCFDLQIFFDSAYANFQKEAVRNGQENDFSAILILTDWKKQNWFKRLRSYAGNGCKPEGTIISGWTLNRTNENNSLFARNGNGQGFFLIAGHKIITSENLEILAIATENVFEDGTSLEETIQAIKKKGALPVIPWAVGKWLGRRGDILRKLLKTTTKLDFSLCDNGNRPFFWPRPYYFKLAETKGIRVLSGSDPLHFTSEVRRAGSFGFSTWNSIDHEHPAKDLIRILQDTTNSFHLYGDLEKPYRFIRNQLAMQILKRKWKSEFKNN